MDTHKQTLTYRQNVKESGPDPTHISLIPQREGSWLSGGKKKKKENILDVRKSVWERKS